MNIEFSMNITNVITTADLKQRVNAKKFNCYSWGSYSLDRYDGKCGYVKDELIKGRVAIFQTGKMISIGAKSVGESAYQLHHSVYLLLQAGLIINIEIEPKVRNLVAVANLNRPIDIGEISLVLGKSMYEPEIFPALVYKARTGITCLIFASGKIVLTGSKSVNNSKATVKEVLSFLPKG